MTFCLGMIVQEGIVGIADSRLTSGNEIISAKKISVYQQGRGSFFIMTSGLRSVRDKALTYFDEAIAIRALVGGQLEHDREHVLYLIYPEGNWVEIGKGTPYQIIGTLGYGKPVLDRTLKYEDSLRFALKVGCLAFDSTRISAADVDYPIDLVIYGKNSYHITEHRYCEQDLAPISDWWQERLRNSVHELPAEWIDRVFINVLPTVDKVL